MEKTISHLAVIMDGNRRWAKKNNISFALGYGDGGYAAVKRTMEFCCKKGIKHLSLYAFSIENLKRPQEEQNILFNVIVDQGIKNVPYLKQHGIRVKFVGDRTLFPEKVLPICTEIEKETADGTQLFVNILFCYGARQELVCGIKALVQKIKQGLLSENQITEETLSDCLWMAGIPEPELIIRTSGVQRLSNFLLYQAAYSEFYFLDCLWPEVTSEHLEKAFSSFWGTRRNFGV